MNFNNLLWNVESVVKFSSSVHIVSNGNSRITLSNKLFDLKFYVDHKVEKARRNEK